MKTLALLVVLALAAAGAYAYTLLGRIDEPFRGYEGDSQLISIQPGSSTRTIGASLVSAGVVRDELTYRVTLWRTGQARRLQAGDYRFDAAMSARDVVEKIARGEVDRVPITFPEGLTIREMATIAAEGGFGTAAAFVSAARNASLIADLDPQARDLEGYLFPDTYSLPRTTDAAQLVQLMVDRFKQVLTPALRQAATDNGWNVRQLVTLASIVEKETGRGDERPTVAAVYRNRLKVGMGLQCDPTVIYALQLAGKFTGNLRRDDLQFDSPYNTYRYAGLPPGPIASPGQASLEAAARPADADYLYFVSRNDGSHEFARTLAEHNRNVQRFQVQYFRERREAARRERALAGASR
jgi:UPF0755 protein